MKNISILFISFFLFISCDKTPENRQSLETLITNKDEKGIRAKKASVLKSYDSISNVLATIENALSTFSSDKNLPLVSTFIVKENNFKHYVTLQGDVATKQNIIIFPEYAGTLQRVYVTEGQRVVKGQLLAIIDDGGLRQQVAQLETQVQLAKTTFERQKRLWKEKIGSEIQFLQTKTNYQAQTSALNHLKKRLSKTRVTAPFSGIIDDVISEQGQVVAPGQSMLFRIVNLSNMYVKADVPESYLNSIKKGTTANVQFLSIGKEVFGKVRQVSNVINPNNRTFRIEIAVPNKDKKIKPNLIANLEILDYQNDNALLVPTDVIQENAKGEKFVFIVKPIKENEATVVKTIITTGISYNNLIEITNGLNTNTTIVKEGAITLRDGLTVKIID